MAEGGNRYPEHIEEILPECLICLETIKDARLLPMCGHTFCMECLQKHKSTSSIQHEVIECPKCRKRMRLPDKGVSGLPKNYSLQTTIDRLQELRLGHTTHPITEAAKQPSTEQVKYVVKCKKHTTQVPYFYCETCDGALICGDCTVLDHKHHRFVNVKDKSDQLKAGLLHLIGQHQTMTAGILNENQADAIAAIRHNIQCLKNEVETCAAKKIEAIEEEKARFVARVQEVGHKMEEETNNMYCNNNPIDSIVEMVDRGNEFEITEQYSDAQTQLITSLTEMIGKVKAKIMPKVAKCLSIKEPLAHERTPAPSLCDLTIVNLLWKPAEKRELKHCLNIISFTYTPQGHWFTVSGQQERCHKNRITVHNLSYRGKTALLNVSNVYSIPGRTVDITSTRDGTILMLVQWNTSWNLFSHANGMQCQSMHLFDTEQTGDESMTVNLNPEDQMCIPEINGHNIHLIKTRNFSRETFSANSFAHPLNAVHTGSCIYYITSRKEVLCRTVSRDAIPEVCRVGSKRGDPAQLLVDPITKEILVVYHQILGSSNFQLSICQLGCTKCVVDPVELTWLPTVKKVDISSCGNLAILLSKDQITMILEYERDLMPNLSDIPAISSCLE